MNHSSLFDLSGHGYFIWASYGMLALAIACELLFLKRRRKQALRQALLVGAENPVKKATVKISTPKQVP